VRRVVCIAPKAHSTTASELSVLTTPLTGISILGTMLHQKGYDVTIIDESIKIPQYRHIEAEYAFISAMSATVKRAYDLADMFKERGTNIFMGGLHTTFRPKEALSHCDKVVVGEGEHVLDDLFSKQSQKIIQGKQVLHLDDIPLPDYQLIQGMPKHPKVVSICSSRGCPFSCRFCSLQSMFGKPFRSMSTSKVITYLKQFSHIKNLCFDEPNFTADKQRAIDILTQMKDHGISPKYAWPSVSIDVARNEKLLQLCSEVADFHFLIGLESINEKVLKSYNKKHRPEQMKQDIKKLHDYGIKVQGSFIFGSDLDDISVFQKTVDFCQDADVDFPGFFPLTPYVGTEIRKDLEDQHRIFTDDWDYYDGAHVVFYPKQMTPLELQQGVIDAFQSFYSGKKILHHFSQGELFIAGQTTAFKLLIKRIIHRHQYYLEYLEEKEKEKKELERYEF